VQTCVHARMTCVHRSVGATYSAFDYPFVLGIIHGWKRRMVQLCRFETSVLPYICESKRSLFCQACLLATTLIATIRSRCVCIQIAYFNMRNHACKLQFVQLGVQERMLVCELS
jgi:hypothetical protein